MMNPKSPPAVKAKKNSPGFFRKVWALVATIPPGKVMTYGQIAAELDNICSARYVGWAMASAPGDGGLPCHRVLNRLGEMAQGQIFGGPDRQRALLESEGVSFTGKGRVDLARCLHHAKDKGPARSLLE